MSTSISSSDIDSMLKIRRVVSALDIELVRTVYEEMEIKLRA